MRKAKYKKLSSKDFLSNSGNEQLTIRIRNAIEIHFNVVVNSVAQNRYCGPGLPQDQGTSIEAKTSPKQIRQDLSKNKSARSDLGQHYCQH